MARTPHTEEEIQRRIDSLTPAAADFLYSSEMGALVKQISDKYELHIDKMALLEAEIGELMLGLTEPKDFVPNITASLQVTPDAANAIAKDVNDNLMLKMRQLMGAPGPETESEPAAQVKPEPKASSSPVVPTPSITPALTPKPAPIAAPVPPTTPKPAPAPDVSAAEMMLSEKKVETSSKLVPPPTPLNTPSAPVAPVPADKPGPAPASAQQNQAAPQPYKADPYREPIEP